MFMYQATSRSISLDIEELCIKQQQSSCCFVSHVLGSMQRKVSTGTSPIGFGANTGIGQ